MVWWIKPMQRKADMTWQLVAESDEGGGFYPCCDHPHATAEEAQTCAEARKASDSITGIPTFAVDRAARATEGGRGGDAG